MTRYLGKGAVAIFACLAFAAACDTKEQQLEENFNFDGTCVNCHAGLSAGQVHPTYKLRCIDCHGGDDQFEIPENAFEDENIFRDPALVKATHVKPKADLARFFFANGIDDDADGVVDEAIQFDNDAAPTQVLDFGEIAELNLQGEGVGNFVDSELNRDLNYVRWLNPGDLRVATLTCGSGSKAGEGEGTVCHQTVVDSMRRSIMTNMSAVVAGAYYGNESWRQQFQIDRDDEGGAVDPRAGAFAFTLAYDAADGCIVDDPTNDVRPAGREQNVFDSACLEGNAVARDPNAGAGGPGNSGLPAFEITQDTLPALPGDQLPAGTTIVHEGVFQPRFRWGGNELKDANAALPELEPVPDLNFDLVGGLADPIDLVLRGFRAYYPLNYPGSTGNFPFTFGESILPNFVNIQTNNPFGRGHSTGCTSCHMAYNYSGARDPQPVITLKEDGSTDVEFVVDPTTKHREFDPATQDIVKIDGEDRLVGATINIGQRDVDKDGDVDVDDPNSPDREQQRYYSADHELDTRITTQQCGLCHAFVTRIDMAYQGIAEDEQRDPLARDEAIRFQTPAGTNVIIHSSFVFERFENGAFQELVVPDGVDIITLAKQRDANLATMNLIPGAGGCAYKTFTEDCNNNGELDTDLLLQRVNEDGDVIAEFVLPSEDLNGNGQLDLIDHVPREESVDGRQFRYVYGGANGSTRMMDIHFEMGMECIDCHMIQDSHGDGNIYSTNWELIEIECEDCHGDLEKSRLFTTGATGLNDMRNMFDHDGRPFFEDQGDRVIQRSRTVPGLFWEVVQTADVVDPDSKFFNPEALFAHDAEHIADAAQAGEFTKGSEFAGAPGESELTDAKLECYSCHMSWIHNCLGCHFNVNLQPQRKFVNAAGAVTEVAGENEVWFNNKNQEGATNFQLLSFMRSPFVLGYNASADSQRLSTFRSSMIVQVSVNDDNGQSIVDNTNFTTFQALDANSGRQNVATSGSAMNQQMPHTVRPFETRGCEQCHALVDEDGAIRNDHILAETFGLGANRYAYLGDWAFVVGAGGLEMFEYKNENQFQLINAGGGANSRWPGIIVNGSNADRIQANVEPVLPATFVGSDVAFIRNFNPTPAVAGGTEPPTLQDLAVIIGNDGGQARLIVAEVAARSQAVTRPTPNVMNGGGGIPAAPQAVQGNLPGIVSSVAHLAPDVSDPFLYIASSVGLIPVEILLPPTNAGVNFAQVVNVGAPVAPPGGQTPIEVMLAGDIAYVGTQQGTIEVYDLSDPRVPVHRTSVDLGGGAVRGIDVSAFVLYAATPGGLAAVDITDLFTPRVLAGANDFIVVPGIDARGLFFSSGHVYVAAGAGGVLDIDVTTSAKPVNRGDLAGALGQAVNAQDVIVSKVPTQTWVLAADLNGDLVGIKLDNTLSTRERCFQGGEIQADCGLDMDFRDPTIMGRDPTFINGQFDPDPATGGPPFFRINSGIVNSGVRLARPVFWEKINTHTGRRYRDSFMPGSGTLSTQVMQRMYNVKVCEGPDPDISGNGLHGFGFAEGEGSTFLQDGNCVPFTELDPSSIGGERQAKHEPGDDAAKGDTTERVDAQPSAWSNLKPGVRAGERIRKRAPARRIGRPVPMSVNDAMCMTGATRALARSCQ